MSLRLVRNLTQSSLRLSLSLDALQFALVIIGCMHSPPILGRAAQAAVAALVLLGLLGGSLIVAHAGFATSPRRGGPSTFVPAPEAYVLAAIMYAMSVLGLLALLRSRNASRTSTAMALVLYGAAAALASAVLA